MSRILKVAAAQLGPIALDEPRSSAVGRMIVLLQNAKAQGAELVIFPELALTTFFPRWYLEDPDELEAFFETEMPNQTTQPLFDAAARMGIGFYLGYAELCVENGQRHQFNTTILVDRSGTIIGKYRKIHLPGHSEHEPEREREKRDGFFLWTQGEGLKKFLEKIYFFSKYQLFENY